MKSQFLKIVIFLFLACTANVFASSNTAPLPANEAFMFSTTVIQPNEILANWRIAPNVYLYRDRIKVTFFPAIKTNLSFPAGEFLKDIKNGKEEVYSGQLTIPITLHDNQPAVKMLVSYQGCSRDGFCYPPIKKTIDINFTNGTSELNAPPTELNSLMTSQEKIQSLLQTGNLVLNLLIFLGIGLLLSLTPCVLPMVPILTGIIVGQKGVVTTKKAFMLSLVYVLGMAITYAAAGLIAAKFGGSVQVWLQKPFFILLGSLLFVILGVGLLGLYDFRFSHHWQNWVTIWSNRHQSGTFLGVFSMGVLSTLILSPCVTAPLIGVLMYIGQSGDMLLGSTALFVMGLGMGIPLLLVGMSAGNWLPKTGSWMETIKQAFGFLMMAMAIWLISRILSASVTQALWVFWAVAFLIYVFFMLPQFTEYKWLSRSAVLGIGLLAGFLVFKTGYHPVVNIQENAGTFAIVKNDGDLDAALQNAKLSRQPVMLDFYADWCEACVEMDKNVFSKPEIIQQLTGFALIRVDLSSNDLADELLLKKYNVIAPPTMLFFTVAGQEVNSRRIVGGVSAAELTSRLNLFIAEGCDQKQYC